MKLKVKLICGLRQDQEYSIDADEAHKAYYAFENPTVRVIFDGGLAIRGSDIQRIVPDWHGTMGWNPTHKLEGDDWNEIRTSGAIKLDKLLKAASEIGKRGDPQELQEPLSTLIEKKYPQLVASTETREGKLTSIKELMSRNTPHPI